MNESVARLTCLFLLAGTWISPLQASPDKKLTPAEVVARHLESIGSAEARAQAQVIKITGTCELTARLGGSGQSAGAVSMASRGNQNLIRMTFDSGDSTSLSFDGSKTTVSQFRPGRRTPIEHFFAAYEGIVKEGLVGGTLSESWPLLDLQQKNPKLEYAGLKKTGGKEMHVVKYIPRKGSDLKITLFFEPQTFRHVRTEYEQTIYATVQRRISGGSGGLPSIESPQAVAARLNAYEEFSDFKPEGGLNLPHTYKFELSIQSEVKPALVDWVFRLASFTFNEPLDAKDFSGVESP